MKHSAVLRWRAAQITVHSNNTACRTMQYVETLHPTSRYYSTHQRKDEYSTVHFTKNTVIRGLRQYSLQVDRVAAQNGLY